MDMYFLKRYIIFVLFCSFWACQDTIEPLVTDPSKDIDQDNAIKTLELNSSIKVLCEGNSIPIFLNSGQIYYFDVDWKIEPEIGKMILGEYVAPSNFNGVKEVKITATLKRNPGIKGTLILKLESNNSNAYITNLEGLNAPYDALFLEDGHILVTTNFYNPYTGAKVPPREMDDFLVHKFNSFGEKIWETRLGTGMSRIIKTFDKHIFVAGTIMGHGEVIVKMDQSGNVISKKIFRNIYIQDLEINEDGQIYIGYREILGELNHIGHLAKLDESLELIWDKPLGKKFISEIKMAGNGHYYFIFINTFSNPIFILGVFDREGNILWEKESPNGSWSMKNIQKLGAENRLIAVFTSKIEEPFISKNTVFSVDINGNETVLQELNSSQYGRSFTLNHIFIDPQGQMVLLGNYVDSHGDGTLQYVNFRLLFIDKIGSILKEWEFEKIPNTFGQFHYNVNGFRIHQLGEKILILGLTYNKVFILKMEKDLIISECQRMNVL